MVDDSGPGYIAALVLGNIGVAMLVIMYLLLQVGKVEATDLKYSLINLLGSCLIGVSLIFRFNIPSAAIEVCWALFSIIGIIRWLRRRHKKKKLLKEGVGGEESGKESGVESGKEMEVDQCDVENGEGMRVAQES